MHHIFANQNIGHLDALMVLMAIYESNCVCTWQMWGRYIYWTEAEGISNKIKYIKMIIEYSDVVAYLMHAPNWWQSIYFLILCWIQMFLHSVTLFFFNNWWFYCSGYCMYSYLQWGFGIEFSLRYSDYMVENLPIRPLK